MGRRRHRNIFVEAVVVSSDPGLVVDPSVGGSIKRDKRRGVVNKKRNAVAETNGFCPPLEVIAEVLIDVHRLVGKPGSSSFGGKDSVEEESAREENVTGVEQLACERGKLLFSRVSPGEPLLEQRGEGRNLILRKRSQC